MKKQTHEICLAAVHANGGSLEYVKEQTPEICLAAVQENGKALRYVKEQTHEICLAAVQGNGYALEYVGETTLNIIYDGSTFKSLIYYQAAEVYHPLLVARRNAWRFLSRIFIPDIAKRICLSLE